MHVFYYNENYEYIGEADIDDAELPPKSTTTKISSKMYLPKYDPSTDTWFESATQEYIESVTPPEPEPNPTELLKKQNAVLSYQIAQLQIQIEQLKGGTSA